MFVLFISIVTIGCQKEKTDEEKYQSLTVEEYIKTLKTERYNYERAPMFSKTEIPALLQHCSDTQFIQNYPKVSQSSYPRPAQQLGFIVLWTIEGILTGTNPASHRPVLYQTLEDGKEMVVTDLNAVAEIYMQWHRDNESAPPGSALKGTAFFWR